MRRILILSFAILLLSSYSLGGAWISRATGQTAPTQRDPQAITVLTEAVNVAGGVAALSAIQDFTASGQITYYWPAGPVQGSVSVKGRGQGQIRLDATLPAGVRSWIVNNGTVMLKNPGGTSVPLPAQNTLKAVAVTFPNLLVLAAVQDPSWSASYLGLVTYNGQQAYDISIQRVFASGSDPSGGLAKLTSTDLVIDPQTFNLLSLRDKADPRDNGPGSSPHELQFANYQRVSGILVPLSVTELIAGQRTVSFQITQVTFNSGLTNTDFQP